VTIDYEFDRGRLIKSNFNEQVDLKSLTSRTQETYQLGDLIHMLQTSMTNGNQDLQKVFDTIKSSRMDSPYRHSDYIYEANIQGIAKARADCRAEMIKIVDEVRRGNFDLPTILTRRRLTK
jgi:hypothetical protein